ncbi:MAG: DUF503 domain-containing protein, partial [Halanaerobiales bacterium]
MAVSLKDKRRLLNSLQDKLNNKFNIAIAEIEDNDFWKKSVLGLVSISNKNVQLEKLLNKIINFVDQFEGVILVDYSVDYY